MKKCLLLCWQQRAKASRPYMRKYAFPHALQSTTTGKLRVESMIIGILIHLEISEEAAHPLYFREVMAWLPKQERER